MTVTATGMLHITVKTSNLIKV